MKEKELEKAPFFSCSTKSPTQNKTQFFAEKAKSLSVLFCSPSITSLVFTSHPNFSTLPEKGKEQKPNTPIKTNQSKVT